MTDGGSLSGFDDGRMLMRFSELCEDWYKARDELCGVLGLSDKERNLTMSYIEDDTKRLPSWISISNTGTGEGYKVSFTGDCYTNESNVSNAVMKRIVESITMALQTLSETGTSARVWLPEH